MSVYFSLKVVYRYKHPKTGEMPPPWVVGVTQQQLKPFTLENGSSSSTAIYFSAFVQTEMQANSIAVQPHHLENTNTHRVKEFCSHLKGLTAHWVHDLCPLATTPHGVLVIPKATGLQL